MYGPRLSPHPISCTIFVLLLQLPPVSCLRSGVTKRALLPPPHCGVGLAFLSRKGFSMSSLVDSRRWAMIVKKKGRHIIPGIHPTGSRCLCTYSLMLALCTCCVCAAFHVTPTNILVKKRKTNRCEHLYSSSIQRQQQQCCLVFQVASREHPLRETSSQNGCGLPAVDRRSRFVFFFVNDNRAEQQPGTYTMMVQQQYYSSSSIVCSQTYSSSCR